jgi:protein TonB
VFDDITNREGGKRAARRASYIVGSSAAQMAIVAGIISLSAAISAKVSEGPLVPVKIVRSTAPPPPPAPPAPKPKAPPKPKQQAPKPRPPSPTAMIQPKETPVELKAPAPAPEDEGGGEEGGVVGGVAGVVGGGPPAEKPAGPVKFNSAMTPPVMVAGSPLEYTQQALEREVEGVMVVECLVAVDGTVHACRVLKSLPFMDRTVVENLEHRRYKPATLGGKPLDVRYTFTIRLELPR